MAEPSGRTFSDADDEEIMRATYRALREYGYADLTIKRIADRGGVRQVDRRDTLPLRHEGGAAGGVSTTS